MDAASLTRDLKAHAALRGVDLVGCTSVRPLRAGRGRGEVDPQSLMPDARAIVIAACYMYGFESAEPSAPGAPRGRFGPWTRGSLAATAYGAKVVREFLEGRGYRAIDAPDLPYKMAAVRSGIVCYGKNSIVHAGNFGSYLKLSGVVTNAGLECLDGPLDASDCGDCTACMDACPTGALARPYHLDVDRCICAWLWGRPIARPMREKVGAYIFRCGYCQEACPRNWDLRPRQAWPFALEAKSDRPELLPLLAADEATLAAALPAFVMQAGADTVRRNVAIALGNTGDPAAIPALVAALGLAHAETRGAAAWALGRLGGSQTTAALRDALAGEREPGVVDEIREALHAATVRSPPA